MGRNICFRIGVIERYDLHSHRLADRRHGSDDRVFDLKRPAGDAFGEIFAGDVLHRDEERLVFMMQAVDAGEIRPTEPIQLMITVLGMTVMSFISQPTMTALDPAAMADQAAFLKRRKQHIVEVLTHGLAS